MKKLFYFIGALIIIAAGIVVGTLVFKKTGISDYVTDKKNESIAADVAVKVGDVNITKTELIAYYEAMKNQVEAIYSDKVWSVQISEDGTSYGDKLKNSVVDKVVFIKLVSSMASKYDVELSADDKATIEGYVKDFFASINETTATKYNLTSEVVYGIYKDNVLCRKVYDKITLNVETDASIETCKQADFIRLRANKYYLAADGEKKYYTEEELTSVKAIADEASGVSSASDFMALCKKTGDYDDSRVTLGKNNTEKSVADVIFALEKDQASKVIEDSDAYYVYFCENPYNEDATSKAVTDKAETDRKNEFISLYTKWRDSTEIVVNDDVVNNMK